MEFEGKVAVITGAGSGMGLLSAQELAKTGAKVVLVDVNLAAVEMAAADIKSTGGEALGLEADVRVYAQVNAVVEATRKQFGRIDLCSDKAAFITGTNYLIDGGRSCGGMD